MEKKILLIPDIHGRDFWRKATEEYTDKVDKVIIFGDEVDPYQDEGYTRRDAKTTLRDVIHYKQNNMDKVILLWGNHSLQYVTNDFYTRSRYSSSDAWTLSELYNSHRSLWQLAYEYKLGEKNYLFTHAGLMPSWYERNKQIIGDLTVDNLNKLFYTKDGITALCDTSRFRTRYSYSPSGSIVWSDVRERTIENGDVEGWDYQIFSHTQQMDYPIIESTYACIDTRQAYILNENGRFELLEQDKGKK